MTSRTGASMAVGAMIFVQLGSVVSIPVLEQAGAAGAAWLRLAWASVLLLVLVRPRFWRFGRRALWTCVALGVVTAGTTILFLESIARLPLGTATALEFLGPLGVAVVRGPRGGWPFPLLAAAGVLLLTEPWQGGTDLTGVLCALAAGACWAGYIVLTQRVGDALPGLTGLALATPVAALVASLVAGPAVIATMSPALLLAGGVGLALLGQIIPFGLEMRALRTLSTAAFGTLMSLEPAAALITGWLLLDQVPGLLPMAGLVLVVAAGLGAERTGARPPAVLPTTPAVLPPGPPAPGGGVRPGPSRPAAAAAARPDPAASVPSPATGDRCETR